MLYVTEIERLPFPKFFFCKNNFKTFEVFVLFLGDTLPVMLVKEKAWT